MIVSTKPTNSDHVLLSTYHGLFFYRCQEQLAIEQEEADMVPFLVNKTTLSQRA
jgi:hypothetical protein